MKKVNFIVAAILIALIVIVVTANYLLIPNNNVIPAFNEGYVNLVIDGDVIVSNEHPKVFNGQVSLPFSQIKQYIDPNIYWDKESQKVTITTKNRVIRMSTNRLDALINSKPINLDIPVTMDNNVIHVPISLLGDFYGIETKYLSGNNVVIIDHKRSIIKVANSIKSGTVVRNGRSIHNPIIEKLGNISEDPDLTNFRIFADYGAWYKVRTAAGTVGFIEKKYITVKTVKVEIAPDLPIDNTWKPENGKINYLWEMLYQGRPDLSQYKKIDGLDIISPTWFQLKNKKGEVINRAYPEYIEWAHQQGYKVWALLSNGFDGEMTNSFLNDCDSRDNLIKHMLTYTSLYKLDGINVDFENIKKEDKDAFTEFLREITALMNEQGLIVSVDINMSASYDRKGISDAVDYVMLMAYDQHWRTSPLAGSVAQITWVEGILKITLQDIPSEKLLLGLPFYTRLWKEAKDKDGDTELSNESLTMEEVKKQVEDNDASVIWDEESGQFYTEYKKDGGICRIWIEDENSINLKSSLVQKYGLAGTAAWSKNFEEPEVWDILNKNLKEIKDYNEWLSLNKNERYVYNQIR